MSVQFDYYYRRETEQFVFYRIPKELFTNPIFRKVSIDAKLLYGLMLDRMGLSRTNGWIDNQGRVYIYFTHAEVQECLQCGHNKAAQLLKELDQGIGLIQRKRQGLGKPDVIYVMNFISAPEHQTSEKGNSAPPPPAEEVQSSENGSSRPTYFQTSGPPKTGVLDFPIKDCNNTENNKTEFNQNQSNRIYPDGSDGWKQQLKQIWSYFALEDQYPRSALDGIFALGADVLSTPSSTIRIGGQNLPADQVKERLLSLDMTHIAYVLECFQKTSTPVRNIWSYLLTALYNAPATIDAYYENLVAQHERTQ